MTTITGELFQMLCIFGRKEFLQFLTKPLGQSGALASSSYGDVQVSPSHGRRYDEVAMGGVVGDVDQEAGGLGLGEDRLVHPGVIGRSHSEEGASEVTGAVFPRLHPDCPFASQFPYLRRRIRGDHLNLCAVFQKRLGLSFRHSPAPYDHTETIPQVQSNRVITGHHAIIAGNRASFNTLRFITNKGIIRIIMLHSGPTGQHAPDSLPARAPHYAFVVLAMGVLTVLGALGLARYPYALILPPMKDALNLNYTEMGLLATGYFAGYLVFAVLTSVLAAKLGSRVVIFVSMVVAGIGLAATGLSQGFLVALAARTVTGAATAGGYVQAMAMPSAWFTFKRRGMAAGSQVGGMGIGFVASGFLIPPVLAASALSGWRYAWLFLGAAVVAIAVAGGIWFRNRPSDLNLLPYGPPETGGTVAAHEGPIGKVYASRLLWHISVVYLLYGFTNIVIMTFISAYLTRELSIDAADAGKVWAVLGVMTVVSGLTWGSISDRLGRRYGLAISLVLLGTGSAGLAGSQDLGFIYVSAALFGFCLTGAPAIVAAASGDYFGPRLAAPALGFLTVSFGIGQAVGPSLAGYIADLTGSFVIPFYLAGAASVLAAAGALLIRR